MVNEDYTEEVLERYQSDLGIPDDDIRQMHDNTFRATFGFWLSETKRIEPTARQLEVFNDARRIYNI